MFDIFIAVGRAWLLFAKIDVIVPLVLASCFSKHRDSLLRAFMILMLGLIINGNLKLFFGIPLPQHLQGFAFPSGHMQSAVVFWGWLIYEYYTPSLLVLGSFLLAGEGYWLTYFGYHSAIDVVGAVIVGLLVLLCYGFILRRYSFISQKNIAEAALLLSIPLALRLVPTMYYQNVMVCQGTLLGFYAGWSLPGVNKKDVGLCVQLLHIAMAVAGIGFCYCILGMTSLSYFSNHYIFLLTAFAGMWCVGGVDRLLALFVRFNH